MEREKIRKRIVITLSSLLGLAILGFLGYRYIAPFGKIVYYRFLSKLPEGEEAVTYSAEKGSILKIPSQIIRIPQSRFSIKLLSPDIESAKVTLKFKEGPKEIKLGVKGNEKDNFLYKPLYHSFLQDLNWGKIEEGDFILWQREKKYQTLYNFINSPPEGKRIASSYVDQNKLLLLKLTEVKEGKVTIKTSLRGNHAFLIQVDKEPLVLKITKQDSNAYEGEDKFKVIVLKEQTTLVEKTIEDDGITDNSRLRTEPQEETITLEDIEPGIYQVNLDLESEGADSLITKIETNQQKIIFKNSVFILGNTPVTLWTNIKKLNIHTVHEEGLQTVKLDDKHGLEIKEVTKQHSFDLESLAGKKETGGLYKLESPKNDLIIQGDGYFAFSQDSFFYPEIIKSVNLNTLSDLKDVDYVLTTCPQAKKEDDWLVAETSFDPNQIKVEGDKLYFSLEIPELSKYGGELEIDYLEIVVKSKGAFETEKESKPSPSPSPSPTPPSTVEAVGAINILVKVLNGGAGKGAAGKVAEKLKENGFTNIKADNADKYDYKNAIVRYREEDKKAAEKISALLKEDYKTIIQKEIATTSAEIVVIIGEK